MLAQVQVNQPSDILAYQFNYSLTIANSGEQLQLALLLEPANRARDTYELQCCAVRSSEVHKLKTTFYSTN